MSTAVKHIKDILTSEFKMENYVDLVREIFSTVKIVAPYNMKKEFSNFSSHVESYAHVGNYETPDSENIAVFAVELKQQTYVENSRSTQRSYAKKLIENGGCDAALIAFYTPGDKDKKWRLSFVVLDYEMKIENGKMKTEEKLTPARRYSYLVGENEPCHTAISRFGKFIRDNSSQPTLAEMEEAFSVEAVTKEFFDLYCEKFYQLVDYLESNDAFKGESERCGFSTEQFAKKLMGQIVFLYFLQKKGWLGVGVWTSKITEKEYKDIFYTTRFSAAQKEQIQKYLPVIYVPFEDGYRFKGLTALESIPDDVEENIANAMPGDRNWGSGSKTFLRTWFDWSAKHDGKFYDNYLEPLFYATLNKNRGDLGYSTVLHCRVPFLSGGLFDPIDGYDWEHTNFDIPDEIFSNKKSKDDLNADGILDIFDRYNFTMSEDEPMEREVAIDPEMLGKVFENLLDEEHRKAKGAFYTPREVVHYICQECLVNYLSANLDISEKSLRGFILYGDFYKDSDTEKTLRVNDSNGKYHMEFDSNRELKISPEIFDPKSGVDRIEEIDELLKNIRVADPAVGSGAFPLGMLNEIVRARQNCSAYMATKMSAYNARLMYINERSAHSLKYETIKNCIFAADIEPSAVDIAQLRLWLALVIDDEINPNAQSLLDGHRNPLPLPNLECNIVCGNSLVDEFGGTCLVPQSDLLNTSMSGQEYSWYQMELDSLIPKLVELQDKLFRCEDTTKKRKYLEDINAIKDQIIHIQLDNLSSDMRKEYEDSKRKTSKPYVLWQVEFAKIFAEKGGFDIVIGNPPYKLCQPSNTDENTLNLFKNNYEVASYKIDLFHLFFEKGLKILKKGGVLGYITPNTYLTNKYIKPLRKFILENCSIHTIVNHDKVFDSASVDTATIIMSKNKCENNNIDVLASNNFAFSKVCQKNQIDWENDADYIFNINNEETVRYSNCVELGKICKTYFGIQAYDRKSSISDVKETVDFLPLIDGADIHPYAFAKPKIYFDYRSENIKSGGDWKVYSKERIVIRQIGQIPIVGLCEKEILGSNTLYSVYVTDEQYDLKYILACLNSVYIKNYWKAKYSDNKATFPKIKGFQLKELPIPIATPEKQKKIVDIIELILIKKQEDELCDVEDYQAKIDELLKDFYQTLD